MSWNIRILVCILFLLSGATGLVYEVVWTRQLSLTFGASHEAVSIVLGAFMAGLALGGWFFGRQAQATKRALRMYGLLELGVAACALALPSLLRLADGMYVAAAQKADGVTWQLTLMRIAMAFAILVLPTFFMGGTLPILTRCVVRRLGDLPVGLSILYAINTAGAVAGTLAAGFILLKYLGAWNTQLLAVGVNVAIGLLAILVDRTQPDETAAPAQQPKTGGPGGPGAVEAPRLAQQTDSDPGHSMALRLAFYGTAVSGLAALGLEVMWTRGLAVCTGTTTYSFTIMLTAFLTGIALGSWMHGLLPLRRLGEGVQFGIVILLIGVTSAVVSQLMPHLPVLALRIDHWLYASSTNVHRGTTLLLSFAVMLVPCLLMGMAFPLAGQARARWRQRLGQAVGDTVSLNTFGAIAGSLVAGFVLIPLLGLQRGMLVLCGLNIGYGVLVLGSALLPRAIIAVGVVSIAAVVALPLTMPGWDISILGVFENNNTKGYFDEAGGIAIRQQMSGTDLLYYREGRGANVSVIQDRSGSRGLIINGDIVATQTPTDLHHELMLGHVPALLHPDPRTVAVVGLGAGITAGSVAAHPSVKELTVVEIEPAVVDAARLFGETNGDVLDSPRVKLVIQDGRNFLLTTNKTFDVITADPIHPWTRGSAYLFTAEYYRLCRSRLAAGGVMCQWLPLYELTPENVKSIIGTFASEFPQATAWLAAADLVLIGSLAPIELDLGELARRIEVPTVRQQLSLVGLDDPLSFLADCIMDDAAVRRFIKGAIINTDDNLYIEFAAPMSVAAEIVPTNVAALLADQTSAAGLISGTAPIIESPLQARAVLDLYRRVKKDVVEMTLDGLMAADSGTDEQLGMVIAALDRTAKALPEYGQAGYIESQLLIDLGRRRAATNLEEAMGIFRQAAQADPDGAEPHVLVGNVLAARGELEGAVAEFQQALQLRPHHVQANGSIGQVLVSLGRASEALPHLAEAAARHPTDAALRTSEGAALFQLGRYDEAIAKFREALAMDPSTANARETLADVLNGTGRKAQAIEVLRDGLKQNPDSVGLATRLAWTLATSTDQSMRDGPEALKLAQRMADSSTSPSPQVLATLAAAQAEVGRFDEAATSARNAANLAERLGHGEQAALIRTQLEKYEAREALRY